MSEFDDDEIDRILRDSSPLEVGDFLNRGGSSQPIGSTVINWRNLRDEDAVQAWSDLRDFVEWFCTRYEITSTMVPDCWYKHPNLVEELSALHTAHTVAFDEADGGWGPIGWHERLTVAMGRIRNAYSNTCRNGHAPITPRTWPTQPDWTSWTTQAHGS